jgi:hypothetical protein
MSGDFGIAINPMVRPTTRVQERPARGISGRAHAWPSATPDRALSPLMSRSPASDLPMPPATPCAGSVASVALRQFVEHGRAGARPPRRARGGERPRLGVRPALPPEPTHVDEVAQRGHVVRGHEPLRDDRLRSRGGAEYPCRRVSGPAQHPHQRGLPGSVAAGDPHHLPRPDLEVHSGEDFASAETLAEPDRGENGLVAHSGFPSTRRVRTVPNPGSSGTDPGSAALSRR